MALVPVAAARWDATPDEIRKGLAGIQRQAEVRLDSRSGSNTFFFRTSEGGTGVMQWLPPKEGDDRSQVRLRYRLILRNTKPAAMAAPPCAGFVGQMSHAIPRVCIDGGLQELLGEGNHCQI
jgi:hypothetical protein